MDRLEQIAAQLVAKVRDDDPERNGAWLRAVTSDEDRWALLFVLAAAVPDDRPWRHLVAWALLPDPEDVVSERRRDLVKALKGTDRDGRRVA